MVDQAVLGFSFLQGVLAFFSPCAVALLPGYLSSFLTDEAGPEGAVSIGQGVRRAAWYGGMSMMGVAAVYGVAGTFLVFAAQLLKENLVYVVIAMGAGIIGLGFLMLMGKPVTLRIHGPQQRFRNRSADAFVFGAAYGLGALGCLFPLFLVVATLAVSAGVPGTAYILAYAVGMALFMLLFYVLALVARDRLQRSLRGVLPYVNQFAGVIVILAGVYIIWYQSALL